MTNNEKYNKLMPKLKPGMFIKAQYINNVSRLGVIVDDKIVYQDGEWDFLSVVLDGFYIACIIAVYDEDTNGFNGCHDSTIIWKRGG